MSFSRRTFLRGLGAAIALPAFEAMAPRGVRAAAAPAPRRFVTWFTACGTIPDNFACPGQVTVIRTANENPDPEVDLLLGEKKTFSLSRILEPLERHKQDLIVLEGIKLAGGGYAHWESAPHQLTAHRYVPGAPTAETASVMSLDQQLADRLVGQTRFPSLQLAVITSPDGDHSGSAISYRGPNQPVQPRNDPYQTFADLFGDLPSGPDNAAALARRLRRKTSILDSVLANAQALRGRISSADQVRLDVHMQAIRDIELQLANTSMCQAPGPGTPVDWMANDNAPAVGKLHMDMLAVAFACDLTRVASLQWAPCGGGGRVHTWIDAPAARAGDWHGVSHADPATLTEGITEIQRWYSGQLAYFVDRLKAYGDAGGGTVFDSTVILSTNEYGHPDHTHDAIPYVLLGSCGGHFKTGRCFTYNTSIYRQEYRTFHGGILSAIQNAMGVAGDFGDPMWANAALPELTTLV
jgi:hypothetical protein